MVKFINNWFRRYFSDPQIVFLVLFLLAVLAIIIGFNDILAPVFIAIVLAYLLEGVIHKIYRFIPRRLPVVIAVYITFLSALLITTFFITPLLWEQMTQLIQEMPKNIEKRAAIITNLTRKIFFYNRKQCRTNYYLYSKVNLPLWGNAFWHFL